MSNTTPNASTGTDDGSHFTIEDAGSTTDPTDLFHNDTTAGEQPHEAVAVHSADEVAAAGAASGPGTQADDASTTTDATGAVRTAGSPPAVPVGSDGSSDSRPAIDATEPTTQEAIPGSQSTTQRTSSEPDATTEQRIPGAQNTGAPVDDYSIGHVFDQTNGVIEGIDGDSDGSAESDVHADGERASADSTVAGAEVRGNREVDDTRSTGD